MDHFLHTLTAYRLDFSYMKRNNPLREELLEKIKNEEKPKVDFNELINELIKLTTTHNYAPLINNGRVVLIEEIKDIETTSNGAKRMFVIPKAGKTNIPIQMVNLKEDKKIYKFGSDWASTYPHNIFVYKYCDELYMVCHRNGGSGCKTVLCSAFNQILKKNGIKVQMNWIPPVIDESISNMDVENITLIYEKNKSPDIADEPDKKPKKVQVKKLTLSLRTGLFENINNLISSYKLKEITKEESFKGIKEEINDNSYNTAYLTVKVGKSKKKIAWDDFEGLIDGFDITEKVSGLNGDEFINELKKCSNEFLFSLIVGK